VPAERLVANFIPQGIKPLCERFDDLCVQDYPIGCIGYAYCLERISALKQKADVDRVQALSPSGADATRFLRTHSGLGSEVAHVEEAIQFIAALPAPDRISVVQETYQSALIMAEGYNHELLKSDAEIIEELEQALAEPLSFRRGSHSSRGEKQRVQAAASALTS